MINPSKLEILIEYACADCTYCPCYKLCEANDFFPNSPCEEIVRRWLEEEE